MLMFLVRNPLGSRAILTTRRIMMICIAATVYIFFVCFPFFTEYGPLSIHKNNTSLTFTLKLSNISMGQESLGFKMWYLIYFLSTQCFPLMCLLTLNLKIVLSLRRRNENIENKTMATSEKNLIPSKQMFILFSISILTLLLSLVGIWEMVGVILVKPWHMYGFLFLVLPLEVINSSANLVFYFVFSKTFRDFVVHKFTRK